MQIRHTAPVDLDAVLSLYSAARRFMAENGNPNQWVNGYPGLEQLQADMAAGGSYVCVDNKKIVGTFFFAVGEEPNYRRIDGSWLNDRPYGVVHRITAAPGTQGVATFCLGWCFAQCGNIRIDTHRDNIPMQKALAKNGYRPCGVIYLENGDERIAFQKEG
ncbi:MAG: GNAT family N-acetyltransferase [Oscillospiraceae bacterium]|nr:GNAT family N-acetyltransferase [Oscillospiraceae bacterium]